MLNSLKAKSLIALLAIAALNSTGAAILFRSAAAQHSDSIQINLAGAERMLSQKMTKEALLLSGNGDPAALKASIARFEKVLKGLAAGDAELELPGTADPEIVGGLAEVEQAWLPIRKSLDRMLENTKNTESGLVPLVAGNMSLLAKMDAVVKIFEKRAREKVDATLKLQVVITASFIAMIFFGWLVAQRTLIQPLMAAVEYVETVSTGDLTTEIAAKHREQGDEIGALARAMQKMSANLRSVIAEISGRTRVVLSSSGDLRTSAAQMSSGSRDASDRAHSVSAAAEQMSVNVISVAASMEQTSTNLDLVAQATVEMTSTISKIAGNSEQAQRITGEATRQAGNITEQIGRLGKAADEIGKVTEAIMEISAQTNLLALNATIEAARAGAAGKGFAVVATEIKALAQQAAHATDDIKTRIAAIQATSSESVAEVGKISGIIADVTGIVNSIAVSIDRQAGVTESIARNISDASIGVRDANMRVAESSQASRAIASDITTVDRVAGDMAKSGEHMRSSAVELANVSEQLRNSVSRFRL